MPMNQLQKGLKVFGPLMRLGQKQRMAGPQVQAAKDGPPRVLAADGHRGRLAPAGPTGPQGRQEQQLGFVLDQEHGPGGQGPNLAANPAFFSLAAGPGPTRNGSVSRRSRARAGAVEACPRRGGARRVDPGPALAAGAGWSNRWPGSQSRAGSGPAPPAGVPPVVHPNAGDGLGQLDGGARPGWRGRGNVQSSDRRCAPRRAVGGPPPPGVDRHRVPATRRRVETRPRRGRAPVRVPSAGVELRLKAILPSLILSQRREHHLLYCDINFADPLSIAIAVIGFLVWGHHMFVAGQSTYGAMTFSILSYLVAVPSAIKVFNWTATLRKGNIRLDTPMLYAIGFIGLFAAGGMTGLFLAALGLDMHVHDTYF